jgi:hypothetical protein
MIVGSAVVPLGEFLAISRGLSAAVLPVPPARFETISVDVIVAISTKRDQIFVCVVTQSASRANVVDLKTIGTAARLASPAVTLQHFSAKSAIRICVEPKSRSPWSKISH